MTYFNAGALGPLVIVAGLAGMIAIGTYRTQPFHGETENAEELAANLESRIRPVGEIRFGPSVPPAPAERPVGESPPPADAPSAPPAPADSPPADGAAIAQQSCYGCHQTGVMDAPKLDDNAAWKARYDQGYDTLLAHAIDGFNTMPPRGGNTALSDGQVEAALRHLLTAAGIGELPDPVSAPMAAAESAPAPAPVASETPAAVPVPDASADTAAAADTDAPGIAVGQPDSGDDASPAAEAPPPVAPEPAPDAPDTVSTEAATPGVHPGRAVYESACARCHDDGLDGAPALNNQMDWATRMASGVNDLLRRVRSDAHVKDLTADDTDELEQAVRYIVETTFAPHDG